MLLGILLLLGASASAADLRWAEIVADEATVYRSAAGKMVPETKLKRGDRVRVSFPARGAWLMAVSPRRPREWSWISARQVRVLEAERRPKPKSVAGDGRWTALLSAGLGFTSGTEILARSGIDSIGIMPLGYAGELGHEWTRAFLAGRFEYLTGRGSVPGFTNAYSFGFFLAGIEGGLRFPLAEVTELSFGSGISKAFGATIQMNNGASDVSASDLSVLVLPFRARIRWALGSAFGVGLEAGYRLFLGDTPATSLSSPIGAVLFVVKL